MPNGNLFYEKNSLCFYEKSIRLSELASKCDGPTYVYQSKLLQDRFKEMQTAFPHFALHYAMKANSHRGVLRLLQEAGAGADVVSAGEIARAAECGFAAKKMIYSGVGKTEKEIRAALSAEIGQFNVESLPEMVRIGRLAREMKTKARIAWRLNPNVDIKTHPSIATGLAENKFGLDLSQLPLLEKTLSENSSLELVGLSLHLGSQMKELDGLRDALKILKPVYQKLAMKYPTFKIFDVGGGLGIFYEADRMADESALLKEYARVIEEEIGDLKAELQMEPGRWIVGHAGVLLTQVQYVKETPDRTFLIVDAGMNDFLRPMLYGATHRMFPLSQDSARALKKYDVVGPICESTDLFARGMFLPELREGEWVAIADTGAYGFSMANNYNLHELPKEILV